MQTGGTGECNGSVCKSLWFVSFSDSLAVMEGVTGGVDVKDRTAAEPDSTPRTSIIGQRKVSLVFGTWYHRLQLQPSPGQLFGKPSGSQGPRTSLGNSSLIVSARSGRSLSYITRNSLHFLWWVRSD